MELSKPRISIVASFIFLMRTIKKQKKKKIRNSVRRKA